MFSIKSKDENFDIEYMKLQDVMSDFFLSKNDCEKMKYAQQGFCIAHQLLQQIKNEKRRIIHE